MGMGVDEARGEHGIHPDDLDGRDGIGAGELPDLIGVSGGQEHAPHRRSRPEQERTGRGEKTTGIHDTCGGDENGLGGVDLDCGSVATRVRDAARDGMAVPCRPMSHPVLRYSLHVVCLILVGPIAYSLALGLRDGTGGHAVTLFHNATLAKAALFGGFTLIAASLVGAIGARLFSTGTGLTVAGYVFAWAGWGLGRVEEIARATNGAMPFVALAAEACIVMAVAAGLTIGFSRLGGGGPGLFTEPRDGGKETNSPADCAMAVGAGVVAAAAAAWFMASSDAHGQTLMGAFFAAAAAGVGAEMALGSKGLRARPLAPVVAVGLVAVAGPLVAMIASSGQTLSDAFAGRLVPLTLPVSLIWAGGAMIGVPKIGRAHV